MMTNPVVTIKMENGDATKAELYRILRQIQ